MAAYIVASYNIKDPDKYENYVPGVIPTLLKHGADILVADYETKNIEGSAPHVTIVLKFESEEVAMNWYNDPDYEPVKQIRLDATEGTLVLTKQFVPPKQ